MATIKKAAIVDIYGTEVSEHLGAEAENIDVSRNSDNEIITDLSLETPVSVEGLATTLKGLEDRLEGHSILMSDGTAVTQRGKLKIVNATVSDDPSIEATVLTITGGGGGGGTVDPSLDPYSVNPVENRVVTAALNTKANTADIGTAAAHNSTTTVTQSSNDLITSGAVYSYVDTMITQALNASY